MMEEVELKHISHQHPITLWDETNHDGAVPPCNSCLLPLSGTSYNCTRCRFALHMSCAKLPNKIIHFLHPKHPLTLLTKTPYKNASPFCDSCADTIWGFSYHCSLCRFDLDIKCVLLQQIVEHEGHEHSFKLHRPTSFPCDACGEIGNDISCICTTCLLLVHKSCASLPPTIKHVGHHHPLSLIQSIQLNDPVDRLCKVCNKDVNTAYWCYYCASCTYITHLNCATSETKLGDEHSELGSATVPNECTIDLISKDVNKITLTKNEPRLQHFSHEHSLTLIDDEPDSEEICDGCVRTISAPYYKCAQCNFFLHASCAELPDKIQHLLHPHSLTLVTLETLNAGIFKCGACYQNFNGFAYGCKVCRFYIDVRCTLVSGILRHEAHEHTLSLQQKRFKSKCNGCFVSRGTKFRCEACDFDLDLRCALLPSSVRHEWDKHPLKLTFTFSITKDKLGQYYCDFCEELRDYPNHWFYYCEDCDVAVHPQCLLGKYMLIKFGKSYKSHICPHLLTLVESTKLPYCRSGLYCRHEKNKDNVLLLECADCNVHFHMYPK